MAGRARGLGIGVKELKDVGATRAGAGEGGCSPASPLCHPREVGEGDKPVPCSESPGVGNRDRHGAVQGTEDMEQALP